MWDSAAGEPSREIWSDVQLVTAAMHRVNQLEYEFFQSAWRVWYGTEPDGRSIEASFHRYLRQQKAPAYVRDYARRILADLLQEVDRGKPQRRLSPVGFALDRAGEFGAATAGAAFVLVLGFVILI